MNFQEQLKTIKTYTKEDCLKPHDFEIDYEHLHLEECTGTRYRHQRITSYTDNELRQLHEAISDKVMELF